MGLPPSMVNQGLFDENDREEGSDEEQDEDDMYDDNSPRERYSIQQDIDLWNNNNSSINLYLLLEYLIFFQL